MDALTELFRSYASSTITDAVTRIRLCTRLLLYGVMIAAYLLPYQRLGLQWWYGLIPFYGRYKMFEAVYGNGWKSFLMYVPILHIYVYFKFHADLAKEFGYSGWLSILSIFNLWYYAILAFGRKVPYEEDRSNFISWLCLMAVFVESLISAAGIFSALILFII